MSGSSVDAVSTFHANPVLAKNVTELHKLQKTLPRVVTNIYKAKKSGEQPGEEERQQR